MFRSFCFLAAEPTADFSAPDSKCCQRKRTPSQGIVCRVIEDGTDKCIQRRNDKRSSPHDKHPSRTAVCPKPKDSAQYQIPAKNSVIAPIQKNRAEYAAQKKIQNVKGDLQNLCRNAASRIRAGSDGTIPIPDRTESVPAQTCGQTVSRPVMTQSKRQRRHTEQIIKQSEQNTEQYRFRHRTPFSGGTCFH